MSALGRACVKTRLGEGCAALFSQLPSSERSCQYNRLPHRRNRDGQKATNAIGFRRSAFASATDMKIARQMLWKTSADGRLPGSIQPLWMNGRFAPEAAVRSAALLTHSPLSTIEVPVHLRSPGEMVPVQASAEPQPVPRRPCRAAPSRRSRTQGQEAAADLLSHRECASPRSARWQEAG